MLSQLSRRIVLLVLCKICFYGEGNDVNAMDTDQKYMEHFYGDYAPDQPDHTNNEDEKYKIFKGTVEIGKEKDGELSYRRAEENEMMINIFCGQKLIINDIFTENNGQFEILVSVNDVELIENCKTAVYIGFYTAKTKIKQMFYDFVKNYPPDDKTSNIKEIYAKLETNICLKFSEEVKNCQNETNNELMNKFKVSFDQKIVNINRATENAEIVSKQHFMKEKHSISKKYFAEQNSNEEGSSSTASGVNKMKQLGKKISSLIPLGGKNKDKKKKKQPYVLDIYKRDRKIW